MSTTNIRARLFSGASAFALFVSALALIAMAPLAFAVGPIVTTTPATSITTNDATLNGLEGDADAIATAFWVSTSTYTPVGGVSPVLPPDVYSTGGLPAVASSTTFSAQLSSATVPAGLLPITAGTTYYFNAWSEDAGGVWTPGAVLSFSTMSAPTITNVTPISGTTLGGTSITITGTGFMTGAGVTVGGNAATSVVVSSSTSITATTPAGTVGPQDVVVTNTDTGAATSTAGFTYTTPVVAAPTVSSISPTSGTTAGGTTVTITGTNLTGATLVQFGTNPATGVVVSSSTSITATSPAGAAGVVDVTVTTPGGTSATSSADQFTYTTPVILAPAISNIAVSGISSTTATVTWTTTPAGSSQVAYGTTASYGASSTLNTTSTTTHSVMLTGLTEGTVYHFAVSSANGTGTTTSSDNTFVTQSTASSTPLTVTSTTPVKTSATADGTFANGWSWVMHITTPDNEDAFRMLFSDWTGPAGTFQGDNNVRISSPQSSNASTTATGIISPDNNYGAWMYLTGDAAAGTPGRQIDVTIEVRIPVGTAAGSYTTNFGANSVPQAATSTTI